MNGEQLLALFCSWGFGSSSCPYCRMKLQDWHNLTPLLLFTLNFGVIDFLNIKATSTTVMVVGT